MDTDSVMRESVWNTSDEKALEITGIHYPRVPVVRRKDYEIAFEQFGEHTFAHCRVLAKHLTPHMRVALNHDFEAALDLHGGPLLVFVANDPKLRKFCEMFGFEHAGYVNTRDGAKAEILIKKKNNNNEQLLPKQQR